MDVSDACVMKQRPNEFVGLKFGDDETHSETHCLSCSSLTLTTSAAMIYIESVLENSVSEAKEPRAAARAELTATGTGTASPLRPLARKPLHIA